MILQRLFELLDLALGLREFLLPGTQVVAPQADLTFPKPVFTMHRHMRRAGHGFLLDELSDDELV
jgi:hypothetical protein